MGLLGKFHFSIGVTPFPCWDNFQKFCLIVGSLHMSQDAPLPLGEIYIIKRVKLGEWSWVIYISILILILYIVLNSRSVYIYIYIYIYICIHIYLYTYIYIYIYKSLKRHLLFLFCYISECLSIPSSDEGIDKHSEI